MFLAAVLQAHTDSVPQDLDSQLDDTVTLERLEEPLAVPVEERVQPLPAAHRSRWV
jgi:hypothetical protein